MPSLGEIIKNYRNKNENKISMDKFSSMSGLSKSYISLLERGTDQRGNVIKPSLETIERVAIAIGVSLTDILNMLGNDAEIIVNTDIEHEKQMNDRIMRYYELLKKLNERDLNIVMNTIDNMIQSYDK